MCVDALLCHHLEVLYHIRVEGEQAVTLGHVGRHVETPVTSR